MARYESIWFIQLKSLSISNHVVLFSVPHLVESSHNALPICSMYGIFTYISTKNGPNVGKYTIHGAYGL